MKHPKRFFQLAIFSLIGTGSLLWFLIRAIPKPSRANYPCMRLAAPLASTFVIWLMGLGTSLLFYKKARLFFRQSKYITAALCLAMGAIAGGIFLSTPHSPTFAEIKANAPIGEAKGANPGRVVWVHDSTVSSWKGQGFGHWWEDKYTNQVIVDTMLSKTMQSLAGKTEDAGAWDTLFRYFNATHGRGNVGYTVGEKIAIKINLTLCNFYPSFCGVDSMTYNLKNRFDYMSTSPQVVRSLLRQLVNVVGVKQSDISIGDPTAYYPNEYYDSCHKEFPDVHYIDHAGKFNRTKVEFSEIPLYWSCRPTVVKKDYIPVHYTEATYLINLANMKSHIGGGLTLCAKNHYGSLITLPTDSGYYDLHQSLAFKTSAIGNYRALVDLMGHAHLGGKTLLYLIDGLYEGNHNRDTVPHKWSEAPFNNGWTSSLFASQDPVAIESVLFDLFQFDPDSYRFHTIAGAQDYLIEAAKADDPASGTFYDPDHETPTIRLHSLGVYEHWNNAVDRKYSRNLSTGNGIELVFIDHAASAIRLNSLSLKQGSAYSLHGVPKSSLVEFTIPQSGFVQLSVCDAAGRSQEPIVDKFMSAGTYQADVARFRQPATGFYFVTLHCREAGESKTVTASGRIALLKK
jgi:uncharacterized protein (DUF362 family)